MISVSASALTAEKAFTRKVQCEGESVSWASELLLSKTLNEALEIPENWAVVVKSGSKLVLKKGCVVKGTLYVEEGGYLAVSGGTLDIQGTVVSDGTISVGKKAALNVAEKGELYVSASGLFKSKTEHISLDDNCSVACLGRTSISGCEQDVKNTFNAEPIFAVNVKKNPYTGGMLEFVQLTPEQAVGTVSGGYYLNDENPAGGCSEVLTVVFGNGSSVRFLHREDKIYNIGGAEMSVLARIAVPKENPPD